ncbi:hypothetical protein GCM10009678_53950 [Actinomadura kijaniata]|uniref:Uncharacterized protein n=1 Tax=Actinomadura namibiensis TaxID=182080 RepID=A0A7W3LRN8_ACTNM|nr:MULTISPECIES: hypothetical protein [Actinomadura]MBA8953043.1 hypothetical protein [Actinomadura namibiensis]
MPKVTDNEDGTKTFSVNSSELRVVKELLEGQVPDLKKVVQTLEGPWLRESLSFIRAVVD